MSGATTADGYKEARVIFQDFEPSNWSWDPVAKQYYFHRFFSHQPDLNFDNPAVRKEMLRVVDFWLGLGVDGLRLDAVPYLFEREGTNCENLPETHAYSCANCARTSTRTSPIACCWPKPINGRRMRSPILRKARNARWRFTSRSCRACSCRCGWRIGFRSPTFGRKLRLSGPTCQWALFVRNHDELTLEMVTDEERDYMYRAYAQESRMRINLGIRRRLCPLLGNNRRAVELINGLLFSLPGTPVLYYGDEIGMGDNVYLGDRDGVRTPMQWSGDRNAGFSSANPQRLILPVVIDYEYHYQTSTWKRRRPIAIRCCGGCAGSSRCAASTRPSGAAPMEFLSPGESARHRLRAIIRERAHSGGRESFALRAVRRARSFALQGDVPGRAVQPFAVSADRRPAVSADARTAWLRVVFIEQAAHRRGRRSLGLRHAANPAHLGD